MTSVTDPSSSFPSYSYTHQSALSQNVKVAIGLAVAVLLVVALFWAIGAIAAYSDELRYRKTHKGLRGHDEKGRVVR